MITLAQIKNFLDTKSIAVAGASAKKIRFGNSIIKEFLAKGYNVYPVHPSSPVIENLKASSSCSLLPEGVTTLFIALNKAKTVEAVKDALTSQIKQIWIQSGSESAEAIDLCKKNGVTVIYGYCPLMFTEQMAFGHKVHRFFVKLTGKFPA